jgi:hypothetical protein
MELNNKKVDKLIEKQELSNYKAKKCNCCNKNLILLETLTNKCKCKNFYCNKHLFYKNHNCEFNYIIEFKEKCSSNIINLENKVIKI